MAGSPLSIFIDNVIILDCCFFLQIVDLGTCRKLAGGRGVETGGGSQLFETQKREES